MIKLLSTAIIILAMGVPSYAREVSEADIKQILTPNEKDISFGSNEAPVTIVEYASMSCSHCAAFHKEIYPLIKENFIDNGKVRFVFRHFPLNPQAVSASKLIECVEEPIRQEKFIKTLFKSLDNWAYKNDYVFRLQKIAKIGGISHEEFEACMANKEVENHVLDQRLKAGKAMIVSSTPTVFVNGEKIENRSYEIISSRINDLID